MKTFIKALKSKAKQFVDLDWKSKIVDLFIVIIGISLAFKLGDWNEEDKEKALVENHILSFMIENTENLKNLHETLAVTKALLKRNDTLRALMLQGNYGDRRLIPYAAGILDDFELNVSVISIESLKESGDFDLIKDFKLRKSIIEAYEGILKVRKMEQELEDYVSSYVNPYFFENIRYRNYYPINDRQMVADHKFENIIIGYGILLKERAVGYDVLSLTLIDFKDQLDRFIKEEL